MAHEVLAAGPYFGKSLTFGVVGAFLRRDGGAIRAPFFITFINIPNPGRRANRYPDFQSIRDVMKQLLSLLFVFLSCTVSAQTYKSWVSEAEAYYAGKQYPQSVASYRQAFALEQKSGNDFYNAACSAALAGMDSLALDWLELAFRHNWTNVRHLKTDSDLNSLYGNKRWETLVAAMQQVVDKREANYDKPLQAKLLAIYEEDQQIRRQYITAQKESGRQSRQVDSLGKLMRYKDSINLIAVTAILDEQGWVGADKVGPQANQTLFLVIQHADLPTQQKYLPVMREAVKNKKASSSSLALLEDRVALGEGRRQLYGSQIGYDETKGKYYVLPLADPDQVDDRRATMGLGRLSDYVKSYDIVWDPESYKKELQAIEENQKKAR
jgi:hypothetical protein